MSLNTSRIYFKLPWSKWEWRAHVARAAPAARASGRLNVGYNFTFNVDYIALRAQRALRALRVRLAVLMSAITCLKLSGITLHAPCAQHARVSQNNFTSNFSFNVGLATQRAPRALRAEAMLVAFLSRGALLAICGICLPAGRMRNAWQQLD